MIGWNRHSVTNFPPSQHNDSEVVKPEDALRRRIRRFVRTMVTKDKTEIQKPSICRLRRASWQEWVKLIMGLFCSVIFLYQDYDRITYYLSVPVTVDVSIVEQDYMTFPAVTVCFTDFGQLTNLLLTPAQKAKLTSCEDETKKTGEQVLNMSNINYWKGRTDINATWITARLEPNLPVKLQKVFVQSSGVCTTFYADSLVKFQGSRQALTFDLIGSKFKCTPYFPRMFCAHLPGEEPNHKDFIGANLGYRGADFGMSIRKYKFLNRQITPCSDARSYWECMNRCINRLWPTLVSCRTHFLPPELTHFPLCSSDKKFRKALVESFYNLAPVDPEKTCHCIQPCERTVFKTNCRPRPKSEPIQRLSLFFEDNFITSFEEHYTYGFIAMLCDIGGIMGLYLGWSVLSICSLIQILYPHMNNSLIKHQTSWAADPIYLKVRKRYELLKNGNKNFFFTLLNRAINPPTPSPVVQPFKYIRYLLLLLCMVCCIYISYDRVTVYLSVPVITTIEIKPQTKVEYPIFTYCKDIDATIKYKQQIAEARNLSSFCEVDFLEILDVPGISISQLWEISFTDANITENTDASVRRLQVLGESCVEVNLGKRVHQGRNIFESIKIMPQCDDSVKLYITPPGGEFDFGHYYVVTNRVFYPRLELKIQEQNVSPLLSNCRSTQEVRQCKDNCVNKRMMGQLKCRFPLMPTAYNSLPLCNSYKQAKEARNTYKGILISTDATNDCKCQRPCHKKVFESDIFVIDGHTWAFPSILTRIGYREPDRQISTEIPSYTTVKLFCDIGGILGLLLGFSFLTFIDIFIREVSLKFKKLFG